MTAVRSQGDLWREIIGGSERLALGANLREVFASRRWACSSSTAWSSHAAPWLRCWSSARWRRWRWRSIGFPGEPSFLPCYRGQFCSYQILYDPCARSRLRIGAYDTSGLSSVSHAFRPALLRYSCNFIVALPDELFEAAGSKARAVSDSHKIIVPLLRPALAGLSVLLFTFVWNDYFWALVLVQSDAAKPLTLGLAGLKGEWLTVGTDFCRCGSCCPAASDAVLPNCRSTSSRADCRGGQA